MQDMLDTSVYDGVETQSKKILEIPEFLVFVSSEVINNGDQGIREQCSVLILGLLIHGFG